MFSGFRSNRESKACFSCGSSIQGGQTFITLPNGKVFHTTCFTCSFCGHVIADSYSTKKGAGAGPGLQPEVESYYHRDCYQQAFAPECCVCHEKLLPDREGLIHYSTTPYWGQKFCTRHATDGTKRCFACNRMESYRERHLVVQEKRQRGVGGGRAICLSCCESIVASSTDVGVIYSDMVQFFRTNGLSLPFNLPIHLVETDALNEANRRQRGHSTMGLTLTEQRTTVKHSMFNSPEVVSKRNEVSAILILCQMPRLLFCSVLAHECTHAYFKLQYFPSIKLQIEEGLCQLMAYLWLKQEVTTSDEQEKQKIYHMNKIFEEESEIYGEGFRMCFAAFNKYGLRNVMNHVKLSSTLPE